jgi:hypothetical protein
MADESELRELCERIGRLGGRGQTRLLEMVLAENRRRWDEEVVRQQAAVAALLEAEKQELAAAEAWYSAQSRSRSLAEETKREAG